MSESVVANVYRPPVVAVARILAGGPRPLSVAGRAVCVLVVAQDELRLLVLVHGPGRRITMRALRSARCCAITERKQTRIELSDGDQFVLAGTLPHGRRGIARRGLPLELGQHPLALTARALGMAGTPLVTFRRAG